MTHPTWDPTWNDRLTPGGQFVLGPEPHHAHDGDAARLESAVGQNTAAPGFGADSDLDVAQDVAQEPPQDPSPQVRGGSRADVALLRRLP